MKTIYVYEQWSTGTPVYMGSLYAEALRGKETCSFEYSREWLKELWKRILFSMAVSNTDDHLRNHGFLMTQEGWRLSPMFDVNPVPYGDTLSMSVIGDDARIDLGLALSAAPHFGLSMGQAEAEAKRMLERIRRDWRATALENGLSRAAIQTMEPAFSLCHE